MDEKKITKIWSSFSETQKAVLYAYLSFCRDTSQFWTYLNYNFDFRRLGTDCDYTAFVQSVESHGYANYRKEINAILDEIGKTDFIYWPGASKRKRYSLKDRLCLFLRKLTIRKRGTPLNIIKPEIYEYILFNPALTESDIKHRNMFFSKLKLIKLAIILQKAENYISDMIETATLSKEELTEIFQIAICISNNSLVQKLMDLGADYHSPDSRGSFPVLTAAYYQKDKEVLKLLIEKGTSLSEHDCYGKNILHEAAANPNSDILKYLLKVVPKSLLEEKDFQNERTPLGMAYQYKRKKNIKLLIKAGANKKTLKVQKKQYFYEQDPNEDSREEFIRLRWRNDNFEWTPENTQKIISVIKGIDKKVNEMYDAVAKTKAFLDSNAIPNNRIKNDYDIEANMTYEYEGALSTADEQMVEQLYDATAWESVPGVYANNDKLKSREEALYLGLNWDIELFDRPELEHIKIPYYVHVLFVDSFSYTLNDMLYMNPDDFKIGIKIHFSDEDIL